MREESQMDKTPKGPNPGPRKLRPPAVRPVSAKPAGDSVTAAEVEADAVTQNEKLGRAVTTQGREITALKRRAEAAEAALAEAQNAVVSLSGEVVRLEAETEKFAKDYEEIHVAYQRAAAERDEAVSSAAKDAAWITAQQASLNQAAEKNASLEADLDRTRAELVLTKGEAASDKAAVSRHAQEMQEASSQAAMANKARIDATSQLAAKTARFEETRLRLEHAASRRDQVSRELENHRAFKPGRGRKARAGHAAEERYLMGKLEAFASLAPKEKAKFDYAAHNHSEHTPCVKLCPAFTEKPGK
jgi:chromosome segregation ATPase